VSGRELTRELHAVDAGDQELDALLHAGDTWTVS
jgi:hypothetical protein